MRKSLVRLYRTRLLRQNFANGSKRDDSTVIPFRKSVCSLFVCGWFEDQEDRIDQDAKYRGCGNGGQSAWE